MPTSPYGHINTFVNYLTEERPRSILDVGLGNGKLGFIARDLLDVMLRERYRSEDWQIKIDGIEVFADYVQEHQKAVYDTIYLGDAFDVIDGLKHYEMVIIGDVLEHFTKEKGWQILFKCFEHSRKSVVLFVPLGDDWGQPEIYGNPYERHLSVWNLDELAPLSKKYKTFSCSDRTHGAFLFDRKQFIQRKARQMQNFISAQREKVEERSDRCREVRQGAIRQKCRLSRETVGAVNLERFEKHVANREHRQYFFDVNFKEHYRLIAYLATLFDNTILFDIGTNLGYSALALSYNPSNIVVSYDIVECKELGSREELTRIEYRLGDARQDPRLLKSPFIMLDTNHDGVFEKELYDYLLKNHYNGLLFLDDIYLNREMKKFWHSISMPKEDISDLGHWSGSGLVDFGL